MIAELGDLGWQVDLLDLGDGFPWPSEATRTAARTQLLAVPAGRTIVVDGLALGVLPETASQLAMRNPLLALVHHPLALEWGLSPEQAGALRSERAGRARSGARRCRHQRGHGAGWSLPITACRPGASPSRGRAAIRRHWRRQPGRVVRLLSVGAVVPRKGFDVLIAALATLTDLPGG